MRNNEIKLLMEQLNELIERNFDTVQQRKSETLRIQKLLEGMSDESKIQILREELESLRQLERSFEDSQEKSRKWIFPTIVLFVIVAIVASAFLFFGKNDSKQVSTDNKTEQLSSKSSDKQQDKGEVEEFEVMPYGKNLEGKVIPNDSSANSLNGTADEKIKTILSNASHRPAALENYATQFGITIPKDIAWTEKKGNKEFLTKQAQAIYWKLEGVLMSAKSENTNNVGVTGYATGVTNGEFGQNTVQGDYNGWSGVKVVYKKHTFYVLDYCGNAVFPRQAPGVKVTPLPIPSTPPNKPKPKEPKQPTPPSSNTPKPEPKDPKKDPVQNGNAPTGGGKNADPKVTEPAQNEPPKFAPKYQAPAAPTTPTAPEPPTTEAPAPGNGSTGGNGGINNAPHGGFSDANGKTVVDPGGAVTTPKTTYGALVPNDSNGGNYTPPPVQNGNTNNSGVNNGSKSGNDIPMD